VSSGYVVGDGALAHPAEGERQPPQRAKTKRLRHRVEPAGQLCGEPHRAPGKPGWDVVERLAGRDDESPDSPPGSSGGEQQQRALVVADEGHVTQVETLQQLLDEPDDPARREVGVRAHRAAMPSQRQGRHDAAVVVAKLTHHVPPQRGVHDQPVQQDDDGPAAARVLVLDRPG
jgi:hypothetical protein